MERPLAYVVASLAGAAIAAAAFLYVQSSERPDSPMRFHIDRAELVNLATRATANQAAGQALRVGDPVVT
jgi:hypothetical protein